MTRMNERVVGSFPSELAYGPSKITEEAMLVGRSKYERPQRQLPSEFLEAAYKTVYSRIFPLWVGLKQYTFEESCALVDGSKSPGFPFFYKFKDNEAALADMVNVRYWFDAWLSGAVSGIFQGTPKDELRKIEDGVTKRARLFAAAPLIMTIAGNMCCRAQNEALQKSLAHGIHPVKIGIPVPSPYFVAEFMNLHDNCIDADGDAWDSSFPVAIALLIWRLRCAAAPDLKPMLDRYYQTVYMGLVNILGRVTALFGNKSGHLCTGIDNSLYSLIALLIGYMAIFGVDKVESFWKEILALISGDDLALSCTDQVAPRLLECFVYLKKYGINYSLGTPHFVDRCSIQFLSCRLQRYFDHEQQRFIWLCAGNLPKLQASLYYFKRSTTMTNDVAQLVHLLGLRICLFPWPVFFNQVNDMIDRLYDRFDPSHRAVIAARISERSIIRIHTGYESGGDETLHPMVIKAIRAILR